eukprot:jgi/Botrbrau1/1863/Bobra.146_1s0050.1
MTTCILVNVIIELWVWPATGLPLYMYMHTLVAFNELTHVRHRGVDCMIHNTMYTYLRKYV